jgi:hypothetical protein
MGLRARSEGSRTSCLSASTNQDGYCCHRSWPREDVITSALDPSSYADDDDDDDEDDNDEMMMSLLCRPATSSYVKEGVLRHLNSRLHKPTPSRCSNTSPSTTRTYFTNITINHLIPKSKLHILQKCRTTSPQVRSSCPLSANLTAPFSITISMNQASALSLM